MLSSTFILVATALLVASQAPTASQLALLDAQYTASGFDTALPNSNAFNVPLVAEATLTVTYAGTQVQNGQSLTTTQVAALPNLVLTPATASASNFTSSSLFTVMLADASAAGGMDPQGDYRHYLANSVPAGSSNNGAIQLNPSSGQVITQYAGPGPLPNSGAHRYAWLVFQQPANFAAPAGFTGNVAPSHWEVGQYVSQANLGALVAASWFTVSASGNPSFSPIATSPVSTVLAVQTSNTVAAASGSQTSMASSSTTAAAAATKTGDGQRVIPGVGMVILAGLAGGFLFA